MRRAGSRGLALAAGLLLAAFAATGRADERGKGTGVVDLKGGKIRDAATLVSLPIGPQKSVVFGLPEGFWVQTPRYLPVPTSMTADGVIVQWLNARGGSPSLMYVGVEPLPAPEGKETPGQRLERVARTFVETLGPKYKRVEFELQPGKLEVAAAAIKVNGKKTAVWRSNRYQTVPMDYGGPRSTLTGECVVFQPEGTEVFVYAALDAKSGGVALDAALKDVSIQDTVAINKAGRIVQLNDLALGAPGRYPVRLLSYESPPGFVVAPSVMRLAGEIVYAEDRLDATGKVTASHRLEQTLASPDRGPAEDAAFYHASFGDKVGPMREVAMATPGTRAWVFARPAEVAGKPVAAQTAVMRFDDMILQFDWYTFGDAATAEKDAAAFEKLLAGVQMAVRW